MPEASLQDPELVVADLVRLRRACSAAPAVARDVAPVIDHLRAGTTRSLPGAAAARVLGVSHSVIARWLREGELLAGRKGSEVDLDDVVDVLERLCSERDGGVERHALAAALRRRLSKRARRAAGESGFAPAQVAAWIRGGLLHGRQERGGALSLPLAEQRWLASHANLTRALHRFAQEPGVDTLVLFGSFARGDEHDGSDVDLVAAGPAIDDLTTRRRLASLLSERLDRDVELTPLTMLAETPGVLVEALADGRVVTDQAGRWRALLADRYRIESDAETERSQARERQARARAALLGETK